MRLRSKDRGRGRRRWRKNKRRRRRAKRRRKGPVLEERGVVKWGGRETQEEWRKCKREDSHGKRGNWSGSVQDLEPTPDSEPCLTKLLHGSHCLVPLNRNVFLCSALIRSGLLGTPVPYIASAWDQSAVRHYFLLCSGWAYAVVSRYARHWTDSLSPQLSLDIQTAA